MKVVTWNLGYWQHVSLHDEAWTYLRNEIAPDIALLQEVHPPQMREGEHIQFVTAYRNWGTAIYTKNSSMEKLEVECFQGRVASALLEVSGGKKLAVVSLHAPIIGGRVFPYLAELFDEIEHVLNGMTFIVGGDLNSARLAEKVWPGYGHGPFFERLAGSIFFDCCRKFHETEQQTYFREGSTHPFQDDHLFVSHDLADLLRFCEPLDNKLTRSYSDHIPLVAEITY